MRRGRSMWIGLILAAAHAWAADPPDETPPGEQFQHFVKAQAQALRAQDRAPASKEDWLARKAAIRSQLEEAWGGFPTEPCPLEPRKLGEVQRDGYRVEKLIFQTLPGVWMTALAYVPAAPGPHPAILQVHGHWKQAKQERVVQSRCIGAAKLGFFVLAVDAFGAGERGIGKDLGEYHGEMVGATLLPLGRPLSGIQVYENMRAVDYLQSRPEVDAKKIGITGASGGGNQSMYAGTYDERIGCIVPVCSVGNYQVYLDAACCMCEVVPGALRFTEEWGVLGLAAPRGLMVVNATKDGIQFSVPEARKSLQAVQPVFDLFGASDHVRHAVFDWHHDYSQPMREAMYGWMTRHLKGQGDGAPIAEPAHDTEDPEEIRCFPRGSRPDDWVTLPQFAAAEGRKLLAGWKVPADSAAWEARDAELRQTLQGKLLVDVAVRTPRETRVVRNAAEKTSTVTFTPEPGITLTLLQEHVAPKNARVAVLLNLDGAEAARTSPLAAKLREAGWDLVTLDLRATGKFAWKSDKIGRAPDHTTAEWSLWIGRPLLGQWVWDVARAVQAVYDTHNPNCHVAVIGQGPAGLVALSCGAVRTAIHAVAAVDTLASYVTPEPYQGQRLGTLVPGLLRDFGDVPHLAALALPHRVVIAGGVNGAGRPLSPEDLRANYAITGRLAALGGYSQRYQLLETSDPAGVVAALAPTP